MQNEYIKSKVVSSLLARVKNNVSQYFAYTESPEEQEENFRLLFLEGSNSVGQGELIATDNYEDRYDKFYVVANALRAELVNRKGLEERQIRLLIDVFDVDLKDIVYTTYIYTPKEYSERGVLLHTSSAKVGQRFETLAHFEAYLWQEYMRLEKGYEFATGFPERAVQPTV